MCEIDRVDTAVVRIDSADVLADAADVCRENTSSHVLLTLLIAIFGDEIISDDIVIQ